jgi:hypothetical protein
LREPSACDPVLIRAGQRVGGSGLTERNRRVCDHRRCVSSRCVVAYWSRIGCAGWEARALWAAVAGRAGSGWR